jgi:glutamate-ammonia-ligase adenylyltransferase
MHYSSDIDLIVVVENIKKHKGIQDLFKKYLMEVQKYLSPFEVDFRLRPEGKSSQLVWDIEDYKKYLKNRARVWEYQAFIKLGFIDGNKNLYDSFILEIQTNLIEDKNKITNEMLAVSKKIQKQGFKNIQGDFNLKKNRGGILSIDFIVHSILMGNKTWYAENMGKSMTDKIEFIIKEDGSTNDLADLIDIYDFYKTLELAVQNIFGTKTSSVPTDPTKRKALSAWFNNDIDKEIIQNRKIVNLLFEKFIGK